jgi:hypothetical protein
MFVPAMVDPFLSMSLDKRPGIIDHTIDSGDHVLLRVVLELSLSGSSSLG